MYDIWWYCHSILLFFEFVITRKPFQQKFVVEYDQHFKPHLQYLQHFE